MVIEKILFIISTKIFQLPFVKGTLRYRKINFFTTSALSQLRYLVFGHKVRFFVIPAEAGIQNLLEILDSGRSDSSRRSASDLRIAGMTESIR
jgi:hypothetical protein